jgi:hypothetical protein
MPARGRGRVFYWAAERRFALYPRVMWQPAICKKAQRGRRPRGAGLQIAIALLASGCGGADASSPLAMDPRTEASGFSIRMHREAEVGDAYRIVERWELVRLTTVRRGDDVVEREEQRRAAMLDADVLVVAVTPEGKELERRYTVRSFRYVWNGVPGAPIPPGSIIRVIAARDGRGVIEWDGEEELPRDAVFALRSVVSTIVRPGTDDEMFGTAEPQEMGQRWSISGARAARDLSAVPGLRVAPGGVHGESVLVEATQLAGIDCLVIETSLDADLSEMPPPREGAIVESAHVSVRLSGHYPLERGLPQMATDRRTELRANGTIPAEQQDQQDQQDEPVEAAVPSTFEIEATTTAERRVFPR